MPDRNPPAPRPVPKLEIDPTDRLRPSVAEEDTRHRASAAGPGGARLDRVRALGNALTALKSLGTLAGLQLGSRVATAGKRFRPTPRPLAAERDFADDVRVTTLEKGYHPKIRRPVVDDDARHEPHMDDDEPHPVPRVAPVNIFRPTPRATVADDDLRAPPRTPPAPRDEALRHEPRIAADDQPRPAPHPAPASTSRPTPRVTAADDDLRAPPRTPPAPDHTVRHEPRMAADDDLSPTFRAPPADDIRPRPRVTAADDAFRHDPRMTAERDVHMESRKEAVSAPRAEAPPRRSGAGQPPKPPRSRKGGGSGSNGNGAGRRWVKRLMLWGLTLGIWVGIGLAGVVAYYAIDLPDIDKMTATTRRPSVVFMSAEGETFAAYGDIYGQPLDLKDIAPAIPQAVMATEDRRFYRHFGLDVWGLARAVVTNLRAGHVVQGGSTITQQLAKNLFLKPDRTLKRKVQELLMALWLEHRFTKEQLLTLYLNRVYLGSGTFGVDAAAKRYFDVSARNVSLYQAAVIAGLLKAPSRYSPLNDPEASHKRTVEVLQNMVEAGYIDQATSDYAALTGAAQMVRRPLPAGRYFADWVMAHMDEMGEVQGKDIIVRTTLDLGLQRRAEAELKALLDANGAKSQVSQGSVVVLSPDGAVRALVGGKEYDDSQFNRATQSLRQPGSSFKPFVYLAAMERGFSPTDVFEDAPLKLGNWTPGNYNGKFEGPVTLRHAFANSTNTVAVRLIEQVGPNRVINLAHKMGITSELRNDASLALGTSETSLLELTTAYAPFANGGEGVTAYGVDSITDPQGKVLWRRQGGGFGQIMSDRALANMHTLMQAVITEGTGKAARLDRPAAGKSGTTQDYRDAWFLGYTADYVAGVWLGNDDQRHEMKKVTGGGLPAQLWKNIMMAAHQGLPPRPLPTPDLTPPPSATDGPGALANEAGQAVESVGNALDSLINSIFGR